MTDEAEKLWLRIIEEKALTTYEAAQAHQLKEWVAGRPWHNPFERDDTRHDGLITKGECCPDFSCCSKQGLVPRALRTAFAEATDEERYAMLTHFLTYYIQDAQP